MPVHSLHAALPWIAPAGTCAGWGVSPRLLLPEHSMK
jgi:hypothetical protein